MTQLNIKTCITGQSCGFQRFAGTSAMNLLNAMQIESGNLDDIPPGYKVSAKKYARKIIKTFNKFGLTLEKPYQIRELVGGGKGMFCVDACGDMYFARGVYASK